MSTATPSAAGAGNGDILDWLHEQGKRRDARVPEFDVERILSVVRAARKSDSRAERAARARNSTLRIVLGGQLRRLREAAGITREDAAARIRASGPKISRIELGRVPVKERDIAELLELYGVTDPRQRDSLLRLTHEAVNPAWHTRYRDTLPNWFEAYRGLEEAAQLIRAYEVQFVPSLLQTEEYARAVMLQSEPDLDSADVERRVAALMRRQKLLYKENPLRLWAIVDEATLRRPMGGRDVLVAQIEHLIDMVGLPNVTLQVLPFRHGGHAAPGGAFSIIRFPEADLSDVVVMHYPTGSLYIDEPIEVDRYGEVMDRFSVEGTPAFMTREILSSMLKEI